MIPFQFSWEIMNLTRNALSNIFLSIGCILLLIKLLFVMGYFNELRIKYDTYVNISCMSFIFIGVVLKSISNKNKENKS